MALAHAGQGWGREGRGAGGVVRPRLPELGPTCPSLRGGKGLQPEQQQGVVCAEDKEQLQRGPGP